MAYHSTRPGETKYHTCRNCDVGNNIEKKYLAEGMGTSRALCDKCSELTKNSKCTPGTPTPAT